MKPDVERTWDERTVSTFKPVTKTGSDVMFKLLGGKKGDKIVLDDPEAAAEFHGKVRSAGCLVGDLGART